MIIRQLKTVVVQESPAEYVTSDDASIIYKFWKNEIEKQPVFNPMKEHVAVFLLDIKLKIIGWELVSIGNLSSSIVTPREVFSLAVRESAYGIILAHNHPSGDASPSGSDKCLRERMAECGKLLGIPLIDFIIIGESYFSFDLAGL